MHKGRKKPHRQWFYYGVPVWALVVFILLAFLISVVLYHERYEAAIFGDCAIVENLGLIAMLNSALANM